MNYFYILVEYHVVEQLQLKNLQTHEYYARLLKGDDLFKMDRIAMVLEPSVVVAYLQKINCRDYEDLIDRVNMYLEEKSLLFYSKISIFNYGF